MAQDLIDPICVVRMAMCQTDADKAHPSPTKQIDHCGGVIGGIDQQRLTLIMHNVPLYGISVNRPMHHVHPERHALGHGFPLIDGNLLERLSSETQGICQRAYLCTIPRLIAAFQRRNIAAGQPRHPCNIPDRESLAGSRFFQDI
jgi:hypothetical protein